MEEKNQLGKFRQIMQTIDLPVIFRITGFLVLALLIIVCVLGGRQYSLYRHCEQVSLVSNQLFFQFSSIKDHLNETLIAGGRINIKELSTELQQLSGSIDRIMDDILIPREVKLSFIHQNDLVGLTVAMRAVGNDSVQSTINKRVVLVSKLNTIHARLARSNRTIRSYTQSLLTGLHKIVAGVLFLAVFIISSMLIIMNRFISRPIMALCRKLSSFQRQNKYSEKETTSCSTLSMNNLQETVSRLIETKAKPGYSSQLYQLGFIGSLTSGFTHDVINLVNGVINYTQAIFDTDKDHISAESRELLNTLLTEEKRMGRHASAFIQFIQSLQGTQSHQQLSILLKQITDFLQELYGSGIDNIELHLDDGLPKVQNHHLEIRLSTLMVLQNYLGPCRATQKSNIEKPVVLCGGYDPENKHDVILTIQYWPPRHVDQGTTGENLLPWQDRSFILDYLRSFGAVLSDWTNPDDQSYTSKIVLPHSCFLSK